MSQTAQHIQASTVADEQAKKDLAAAKAWASVLQKERETFDAACIEYQNKFDAYVKMRTELKAKAAVAMRSAASQQSEVSVTQHKASSIFANNFSELQKYIDEAGKNNAEFKALTFPETCNIPERALFLAIQQIDVKKVQEILDLNINVNAVANIQEPGSQAAQLTPLLYLLHISSSKSNEFINRMPPDRALNTAFIIYDLIQASADINAIFTLKINLIERSLTLLSLGPAGFSLAINDLPLGSTRPFGSFIHQLSRITLGNEALLPVLRFILNHYKPNLDVIHDFDFQQYNPLSACIQAFKNHQIIRSDYQPFNDTNNSKLFKEVFKSLIEAAIRNQLVFSTRAQVSVDLYEMRTDQMTPPMTNFFRRICACKALLRKFKNDVHVQEAFDYAFAYFRWHAMYTIHVSKNSEYRNLEIELDLIGQQLSDFKLCHPGTKPMIAIEIDTNTRLDFLNSVIKNPIINEYKQRLVYGYWMARYITDNENLIILLNAYLDFPDTVLGIPFVNFSKAAYRLQKHLKVPEETPSAEIYDIAISTQIVNYPLQSNMAAGSVMAKIQNNPAFVLETSNEASHKAENEPLLDDADAEWDITPKNAYEKIHQESIMRYRYQDPKSSLDKAAIQFTVQASLQSDHTVIRHFKDGKPNPNMFLYLANQRLCLGPRDPKLIDSLDETSKMGKSIALLKA